MGTAWPPRMRSRATARRGPAQQPRAIRPAVVFEPRAGTARPAVPGHSRRAARSGPDSSGPVAIISAAPLPWSNVHGANPALQRRIATEAPIKLPGNGDRKMGTYRELAQRIRWPARSRPTGSAIARAAAVVATISFAVAACSSAASSTSAAGTGGATPTVSSAAPSASASAAGASAGATPAASSTASSASVITPGHSTPQDAEEGLIKGELANNWAEACSYLVPSSQATCTTGRPGKRIAYSHRQCHGRQRRDIRI